MNVTTAPNVLFTTVSKVCGDDVSLDYFAEVFLDPADAMSAAYWVYLVAVLLPALQKVGAHLYKIFGNYLKRLKLSKCISWAARVLPQEEVNDQVNELEAQAQEKIEEQKGCCFSAFESKGKDIQDAAAGSNANSEKLGDVQQQLLEDERFSGFQRELNCFFVLLQLLALLLAAMRYTWRFPSITGVGSNRQCAIVLWTAMPMVKTIR